MPVLDRAPIEIVAKNLAGRYITHAEKILRPQDVYRGVNWRQNKDGGRYPRPGYEDSTIDYSSFAFTVGRGMLSAKTPARLWLAGDDDTNVKITYVDTDTEGDQYGEVFDVGLTLTTGYRVFMREWQGNIFYANGTNTVGEIITGQVATGGVTAGSATLNLKGGRGTFFPASGSGRIGTDAFSWTGKSGDQLTGCSGLLAHDADEVVTYTTTLSPNYEDKAAFLEEWLSSLNLFGDPDQPFVWEFSKFATAGSPGNFIDFSAAPSSQEIVGQGGKITAALATKNFFYVWKEDSLYATGRTEVDADTGARVPQPIEGASGAANAFCVTQAGKGGDAHYQSPGGRFIRLGLKVESGQTTVGLDDSFDDDLAGIQDAIDKPSSDNWSHYNSEENLLKHSVFEDGVRVIYVWDFNVGTFYKDTNKNYDCVCEHEGKTWAYDGSAGKMYIDETGNFDDDVPVEMEWETGRLGRDQFQLGKARYLHMHGYMVQDSVNYVDFYKNNQYQFTKILDDTYITSLDEDDGVAVGSQGVGSGSSIGSGGSGPIAFPFRFPIGANHLAEDYKIKVRSLGENGEFVQFDGFILGIRPLKRYPYRHA